MFCSLASNIEDVVYGAVPVHFAGKERLGSKGISVSKRFMKIFVVIRY